LALFNFTFKRLPLSQPPAEVVQAACNLYGLSPERVPQVQAEKLKVLSRNIWVVTLNEQSSAVVAYTPGAKEQPLAAPWFSE
jgi:hypothetical protein